ncbi:MAG: hypothetical protein EOP39_22650 [Rubrivivax sp.]|nr:MAG: hypothetical protein EOP39_22650 [Rubrivivax sp.]
MALIWATVNFGLTWPAVEARPFPWLAMLGFAAGPLVLMLGAERIASRLHRGWMERWASDFRKPQSATPIKLMGWLALAAQTIFLLFQIF